MLRFEGENPQVMSDHPTLPGMIEWMTFEQGGWDGFELFTIPDIYCMEVDCMERQYLTPLQCDR